MIYDKILKNKDKIISLYNKNKKLFLMTIFLVLVVIVALVFPVKNFNKTANSESENEYINSTNSYKEELENRLKKMLLKISNITFVDVLIIVESSEINQWQTEKETTKTIGTAGETIVEKEKIVYEKNGSTQKPILVSVLYPKILSVLIVTNNIDASTKVSIKTSIAGVLNLDDESIFILQDR